MTLKKSGRSTRAKRSFGRTERGSTATFVKDPYERRGSDRSKSAREGSRKKSEASSFGERTRTKRAYAEERPYGRSGSYGKKADKASAKGRGGAKRGGGLLRAKKGEEGPVKAKSKRGEWKDSAYKATVTKTPVITPAAPTGPEAFATTSKLPGSGETKERLQKILARAGVASRRKAELLILEGAVTVNGRTVTELGTKVSLTDAIKVNGQMIITEVEPIYMALYKPKAVISALSDPEGRPHLGELLRDVRERVIPIGRMDFNSEGLLLLTNDGQVAEKIFKARGLTRVYMIKIKGHPTERDLEFLKRGIFTAQGVVRVGAMEVEQALRNKSWLKLEVTEGAQLDLREMLNHRGLLVDRIVRTAIGHISIKGLQPGEFRFLRRKDFEELVSGQRQD